MSIPDATTSSKGIIQIGTGVDVSSGSISIADATDTSKGLIQAGAGMAASSGVLSIADATTSSKGAVQVGSGITVSSGVIAATNAVDATTSSKGIIQVGTNFSVSGGVLSANVATDSELGVIRPGAYLSIASGVLSVTAFARRNANTGFSATQQFSVAEFTGSTSFDTNDTEDTLIFNLTANLSLSDTESITSQRGYFKNLVFVQDSSGGHTVTFPGSWITQAGGTPSVDTSPNKITLVMLARTHGSDSGNPRFCEVKTF
jgi:hypothetical protein